MVKYLDIFEAIILLIFNNTLLISSLKSSFESNISPNASEMEHV